MKPTSRLAKVAVAAVVIAVIAVVAILWLRRGGDHAALCHRIGQLCAAPTGSHGACQADIRELENRVGESAVAIAADCVGTAASCREALVCIEVAQRRPKPR